MNGLLHGARHRGIERIVFLGDQRQHHAIEAGRPIYQMQQAGIPVARLEVIRRQRDPNLRQAVTFAAEGRIADALMLLENENRVREIAVARDRYEVIALEYLAAHEADERVLVVSPANDERRQLNSAIRDLLRSRGHIAVEGREQIVFVSRNFTRAQRTHARNFEVGDVVLYRRGSKKLGLARGGYASVEAIDRKHNRITVRAEDARTIQYNPKRPSGVEVFRPEQRVLAVGDRIQFRAPDRALKVANGELATVVAIDAAKAVLRTDTGREVNAALQRLRHIDYGYASTSHSSQGATVDRIVVNIDTLRSAELVNRKQFYVSISRARDGVTIYTDDREALRRAVNRNREKSVALEQDRIRIQPQIKQGAEVQRRISAITTEFTDEPSSERAARRYERGTSGFASFAARPRRATRGSRSAPSRHSGGACCACNRATGAVAPTAALVTVAALRCAHPGIQRRPPVSVERAPPSKCCALSGKSSAPCPCGEAGGTNASELSWVSWRLRLPCVSFEAMLAT